MSSVTLEGGAPALTVWQLTHSGILYLTYYDGVEFWLTPQGDAIWAKWPGSSSIEEAAAYLIGPVLGLLLRLRGITCLHSSAVALGGRAIAFVGPPGAGKSTAAAAFARRGGGVLSDDIVALVEGESSLHVLPAYPHLSLWPDSANAILGPSGATPRSAQTDAKRSLALGTPDLPFETRALPLSSIYILGDRNHRGPSMELLAPREALFALVANSYATNALDSEGRAKEFAILAHLVSTLPVRRLHAHADANRIDQLCELIRSQSETECFPRAGVPASQD